MKYLRVHLSTDYHYVFGGQRIAQNQSSSFAFLLLFQQSGLEPGDHAYISQEACALSFLFCFLWLGDNARPKGCEGSKIFEFLDIRTDIQCLYHICDALELQLANSYKGCHTSALQVISSSYRHSQLANQQAKVEQLTDQNTLEQRQNVVNFLLRLQQSFREDNLPEQASLVLVSKLYSATPRKFCRWSNIPGHHRL